MKKQIDVILLCTLWSIATILGINFWFNTVFGFNIFSASHWEYLSYAQASQTPIKPSFYISIIISVFILIFGLYLIARPRFKRIRLPIMKTIHNQRTPKIDNSSPVIQQDTPPQTITPPPPEQKTIPSNGVARPPRLTLPSGRSSAPTTTQQSYTAPVAPVAPIEPATQKQADYPELRDIFTAAGYTVKPTPQINGTRPDLFAIGTDEVVWIGTVNTSSETLYEMIERLNSVFIDTLEDITININGFIINATDSQTYTDTTILYFSSPEELREFIASTPNPKPDSEDIDNFNAYSTYIDTVIQFIGKTS